jgi:hypothetical protein
MQITLIMKDLPRIKAINTEETRVNNSPLEEGETRRAAWRSRVCYIKLLTVAPPKTSVTLYCLIPFAVQYA